MANPAKLMSKNLACMMKQGVQTGVQTGGSGEIIIPKNLIGTAIKNRTKLQLWASRNSRGKRKHYVSHNLLCSLGCHRSKDRPEPPGASTVPSTEQAPGMCLSIE